MNTTLQKGSNAIIKA